MLTGVSTLDWVQGRAFEQMTFELRPEGQEATCGESIPAKILRW